jgi:hypothetical protein
MVRDAGEQDGCTVSNPAKISGKLPDNGSHETLPAKAFLITEVTGIWTSGHSLNRERYSMPVNPRLGRKIAKYLRPVLNATHQTALFVYRRMNFNGPKCVSFSD